MTARKNNFQVQISFLQEADWANFDAKFLIGCANVHGCNVDDGQAGGLCGLVVDDCLAPCAGVPCATVLGDTVCESAVSFGSDLNLVGALQEKSLL